MTDVATAKSDDGSRRTFLKVGAGVVGGLVIGAAVAYVAKPSTTSTVTCTTTSTTTSTEPPSTTTVTSPVTSTVTGPAVTSTVTCTVTTTSTASSQAVSSTAQGLLTLSSTEALELAAIVDTLIPTDSNGPGANQAGVLFFIDHQLAGNYGQSGWMYMTGAFVPPNLPGPITVECVTYSCGSALSSVCAPTSYQYDINLRGYWRAGLSAFETYCNSAYGANFEDLSSTDQVQALTDLFNNKPTSFNDIQPSEFFYDLFFMTWSGFLMDPLYGGNQNMVGWTLTGFNGVNMGDFYGCGLTTMQLMVATTPTRLKPVSLAQYQQAAGYIPTSTTSSSSSTSSGGA